jgi:hypothetical protein
MKIIIERSPDLEGIVPRVIVKLIDCNGHCFDKYASMSGSGPFLVNWFTPSSNYFREKEFLDYETAWRFMWRKFLEMKG